MPLRANIYKSNGRSFSNDGISASHDEVFVVNAEGPFEPELAPEIPCVEIVPGNVAGSVKAVPVRLRADGRWATEGRGVGPMFGGCFVYSSDSRFHDAVRLVLGGNGYEAVPLHDRFETPQEYKKFSA